MSNGACYVDETRHHPLLLSFLCPFIHSQIDTQLEDLDIKMEPQRTARVPALRGQ